MAPMRPWFLGGFSRNGLLKLGFLFLPLIAFADGSGTGLQRDVVFTEYSSFSRNEELVRRLLTPLNAARIGDAAAHSELALRDQSVDLTREKFVMYVPSRAPPQGYSLLVFVPPWTDARVPQGWTSVLEQHGMILVSAANSGNDADILNRREPLALLAAQNVTSRYPVDPLRVYIGGFSGGSRVALRIALGYPDLFHGVLLNAGSDPIGTADASLPPADLFHTFQVSTRVVYLTGQQDSINLAMDGGSQLSMRNWCVFNVDVLEIPRAGHEVADSVALSRALGRLQGSTAPDVDKLAKCRARVEEKMTAELRQAEELVARGKPGEARKAVERIDARYGGLTGARGVTFVERIETPGVSK